jgi:Tol biopolymer transport system component
MGRLTTTMVVCLCVLLVGAEAARAQYFGRNKVHYEPLDFTRLQTEHFDLYYYAEAEAATIEAGRMAERWYSRYSAVLEHTFAARQPVVLYAGHPHFAQTNLTAGLVSEATGGFTERVKSRIAMPLVAGLGETDHVLGHEIAHAFQIALSKSVGESAFRLPLWFIEGMAEYLSVGPVGSHTAMWIRDAAIDERLPTLEQMEDPSYFPYRYGHAFWAYVCGRFGDGLLGRVLRLKGSAAERLAEATDIDAEALFAGWHASIRESLPDVEHAPSPASTTIAHEAGRIHVGPALSPDGARVMFLSERNGLSLDLFMADAASGAVLRTIVSTAADPHFDSLQYIHSAGAWDPSGHRFAITAVRRGDPVLVIANADGSGTREERRLEGVREIYTPSWSPDGSRIVFSGLKGGFSDLFVYTLDTGALTQITDDRFADVHPVWSPDGRTVAFATDRFTTTLETLAFGALRIGLLDLESGRVRALLPEARHVKQVSPQWEPGGGGLYFVSDRDGTSNVYHATLEGVLRQVTAVRGGVSGIAATSPALAVAATSGALAYSVYRAGRYEIRIIADRSAVPMRPPPDATAHLARAGRAPAGTAGDAAAAARRLADLLDDPVTGLPDPDEFTMEAYDDRLRLESVAHPYIGAAAGGSFGGLLRAGFGVTFGDLLKDRQLQTSIRVGTTVDDFAAQIAYTNRKERWNWGVAAGFQPARFYGAKGAIDNVDGIVTRETSSLRYLHQWGGLVGRYNIDSARRLEIGAGLRRTGFQWSTVTRVVDQHAQRVLSRDRTDTPAGDPIFLAEVQAAYVHDTSVSGPLGPVLGQRLRVEIQPAFGPVNFADVVADVRRYVMPFRPVTFAARVQHVGRYGPDAADPRLTPLIAGLQTFVRGYDLRAFASDQCGRRARACSIIDELTGSRFALINLEARVPIPGVFTGELAYGSIVPVEAIAFVDAGYLWTRSSSGGDEARFRSVGAGARFNLGGAVFELTGARPFDRADLDGWTVSFLIRPGW